MAAQQRRHDVLAAAFRHRDMIQHLGDDVVRNVAATEGWSPAYPDRFESRLRRRAARRMRLSLKVAEDQTEALSLLLNASETVPTIVALCGAACQSAALRLILNAGRWSVLADELGLSGQESKIRKAALAAAPEQLRVIKTQESSPSDEDFADAIFADGLECWECWCAEQTPDIQRYLAHLAPDLPELNEDRAARRKSKEAIARARLFDAILNQHQIDSESEADA